MNKIILNSLEKFPEFLSSHHLVELGIYPDVNATYQSRRKGIGPDYIKLGRRILYPKESVIEFLQSRMKPGYTCKESTNQPLDKAIEKEWYAPEDVMDFINKLSYKPIDK